MGALTADISELAGPPPLPSLAGFGLKNPSDVQNISQDLSDSKGAQDLRRPVLLGEELYESVVSLDDANCTGTIVDIEGYNVAGEGTLIVTAAHCIEDSDPNDIKIAGSYLDNNGQRQQFNLQSSEVWVHPFHGDFNRHSDPGTVDSRADIAFIYSKDAAPAAVLKAEFVPYDLDRLVHDAQQEATPNDAESGNPNVTTAGFSGDKIGLHTHENAKIIGVESSQVLVTEADVAQGASGGPNYPVGEDGTPISLNEDGQPRVATVNSAVDTATADNPNPEWAYSTALKEEFLTTVPFLEAETPVEPMQGTITPAAGANIRYGPGLDFAKLSRDPDGVPSAQSVGSQVSIHDTRENHLGEEWSLVTGENGRTGYINSGLIQQAPAVDASTSAALPKATVSDGVAPAL